MFVLEAGPGHRRSAGRNAGARARRHLRRASSARRGHRTHCAGARADRRALPCDRPAGDRAAARGRSARRRAPALSSRPEAPPRGRPDPVDRRTGPSRSLSARQLHALRTRTLRRLVLIERERDVVDVRRSLRPPSSANVDEEGRAVQVEARMGIRARVRRPARADARRRPPVPGTSSVKSATSAIRGMSAQ